MQTNARITNDQTIVLWIIISLYWAQYAFLRQVSSATLKPGDTLNSTSRLISANGLFALGFYTPPGRTEEGYIAIWNTNGTYLFSYFDKTGKPNTINYPVWIGNRDDPIPDTSFNTSSLALTSTGKLLVANNGGANQSDLPSIVLYQGQESSRKNVVSATLLDSGNFVVKETIRNTSGGGAEEYILWQSFDHPTDVLIPGMKLGVNHKTGRKWTLTSWLGETNPSRGAFTLEWDTVSSMMLVKRRGVVYWTSGKLREQFDDQEGVGYMAFQNMQDNSMVSSNFTSTVDEEYLSYSLTWHQAGLLPVSMWRLEYNGDLIVYGAVTTTTKVSLCNGYDTKVYSEDHVEEYTGCELREQPKCRSRDQTFVLKSGSFSWFDGPGTETVANSSLSESDCREKCWNDCECFAFAWGGGFNGENDVDGRSALIYEGCLYWKG